MGAYLVAHSLPLSCIVSYDRKSGNVPNVSNHAAPQHHVKCPDLVFNNPRWLDTVVDMKTRQDGGRKNRVQLGRLQWWYTRDWHLLCVIEVAIVFACLIIVIYSERSSQLDKFVYNPDVRAEESLVVLHPCAVLSLQQVPALL